MLFGEAFQQVCVLSHFLGFFSAHNIIEMSQRNRQLRQSQQWPVSRKRISFSDCLNQQFRIEGFLTIKASLTQTENEVSISVANCVMYRHYTGILQLSTTATFSRVETKPFFGIMFH